MKTSVRKSCGKITQETSSCIGFWQITEQSRMQNFGRQWKQTQMPIGATKIIKMCK